VDVTGLDPASQAAAAAAAQGRAAPAPPSRMRRWLFIVLASLAPWAVIVAVWELAAVKGWIQSSLLPPPSSFIRYAIESDFRVGFGREAMAIPAAILASAYRVVVGLALGFVAAVVTGIAISMSNVARWSFLPVIRGLAPIAPIAWIPLGIILFGIGNGTAIFVVFVGVYFLLTLSTVAAVQSVDERMVKTARTYGASPRQVWLWVIFPAILPQVFTMLRLNFFAAWMAVLAAEMVGLKNGVGMMVILGREMFNGNLIMLGICIVGITGYAVDSALLFVQRKLLWWSGEGMMTK
jgi:NitT/TauT family transport system permease protein